MQKPKNVRPIVVTRKKDRKAEKRDGPPAFFRFHRPCLYCLRDVSSEDEGTWIWMGRSRVSGTFEGGLDSVKGEEHGGWCLLVE